MSNLSRAYRVNLNVLALVALFTGGFLVFSLQAQATIARRSQLAYLRVAGVTARELQSLLVAEASLLGAVGSALGLLLGAGVATADADACSAATSAAASSPARGPRSSTARSPCCSSSCSGSAPPLRAAGFPPATPRGPRRPWR